MKLNLKKIKVKKPDLSKVKKIRLRKLNIDTLLAIFSYLHILVVIPLLFSKKRPFVSYHAKQGLILLTYITIGFFLFFFPYIPWLIVLFYAICIIWGLVNVLLSKEKKLPLIGILGEKI